ncbi:putative MADS-box domain-containing protein [Seiridium unicorne]|uniref:MADS-box domain-containing protein n=1 Tax=Seiridium unicorne TaxID=138068 RepID=A0ABR2UPN0_9PEZI
MGRRKIEIKAIKDDRNRSVTFLKRKGGLFKKAHELSVLCSVDVAVFIFGSNKKLYEYSSSDMRELIGRYTYHGGPNEHKGPADFNGGADDDEDDEGDGTPPHGHEGSVEPQMMPPQYQNQHHPQFPHLRGHTPSASPPINGVPFPARGHTPQPQMGSRPSSRNDFRRAPGPQPVGPPGPPQTNGFAYMPHPQIYQPQNQNMPPNMQHPMPQQQQPQYPYPPPQHPGHPQMQPYVEDQRRSSVPPPNYPPQGPPQNQQRMSPPQPHPQQLPPQQVSHMSPPQPQHQHLEVPQHHHHRPSQEPQPPAPMEPKPEPLPEKPSQPFLDTASAIKKLPQRKQHSIFTPIDENRSILSQHLASFASEPRGLKEEPGMNGNRSQSVDVGSVSRTNVDSSPPLPQRSNTSNLARSRSSVPTIPETSFTPPSRSNSLRDGAPRPRLRVQIPDEQSEAGSNTAESLTTTSPRNATDSAAQPVRRNGAEAQPAGVVLPPPSPSASTLLSAGATGPPNPFARPLSQSQQGGNMNIDTPVSALPSRFLNTEFLPSPSSFYPEWNFSRNDSNTLPSPLNFATPVQGAGPSFLRDENPNKRKSPEMSAAGPSSDGPEGLEPKRVKVDS